MEVERAAMVERVERVERAAAQAYQRIVRIPIDIQHCNG
jgi:hypothetical protein